MIQEDCFAPRSPLCFPLARSIMAIFRVTYNHLYHHKGTLASLFITLNHMIIVYTKPRASERYALLPGLANTLLELCSVKWYPIPLNHAFSHASHNYRAINFHHSISSSTKLLMCEVNHLEYALQYGNILLDFLDICLLDQ